MCVYGVLGEILVEQAKSVLIMTAAVDHMRNKLQRHKEEVGALSWILETLLSM